MRRPTRTPFHRPAIQTLERLHSELGGKIFENKQEHANLAEQMRRVEAVIKMLDPCRTNRVRGGGTIPALAVDDQIATL